MEDLFGLSLTPIMYLVLFTYVFGGAISGDTHVYLQIALPGILVLTVVFATLGTGMMLNRTSPPASSTGSAPADRPLGAAGGAVFGDTVRYMISSR